MTPQLTVKQLTELTKIADQYIYRGIFNHHLSNEGVIEIIKKYEEIKSKQLSNK